MFFLNSTDVAGKHYTMLSRSRVRASFVKIYVYYSIYQEMADYILLTSITTFSNRNNFPF